MTKEEIVREYASGGRSFRYANLAGVNLRDANLTGADLTRAYLRDAYLADADLTRANLTRVNLTGAYLAGVNLRDADLTRANLTGANLTGADLTGAYLMGANLTGVNLTGAYLTGVNLRGSTGFSTLESARRQIVTATGPIWVWKKLKGDIICHLVIPDGVPRVGGVVGRKCRAERAYVVSGNGVSGRNGGFVYTEGTIIVSEGWDPNPLVECSGGIHFFITREEAEEYIFC